MTNERAGRKAKKRLSYEAVFDHDIFCSMSGMALVHVFVVYGEEEPSPISLAVYAG